MLVVDKDKPAVSLVQAIRRTINRVAESKVAQKRCPSEEFRLRVHACALRLLDALTNSLPGFMPESVRMSTAAPPANVVKTIGLAIYGCAYAYEDNDDGVGSDRAWTRKTQGIAQADVAAMEWRITQLYFQKGICSLRA